MCSELFVTGLRRMVAAALLLVATTRVVASDKGLAPADTSGFVTASLITTTPTASAWSAFGHTALRMECPQHNLDYVFTYEVEGTSFFYARLLAGKAKARYMAVPTNEFLEVMSREGRGVSQKELNLAREEKQELWRLLDEDMAEGPTHRFTLLSHCASVAIDKVEQCSGKEIDWGQWQEDMLKNNGDLLRVYTHHAPWAEFLFITLIGNHYGGHYGQQQRMSPQMLESQAERATLTSPGDSLPRPLLTGKNVRLIEEKQAKNGAAPTPLIIFGLLLAVAVMVTLSERKGRLKTAARCLDILLLAGQTAAGIALLVNLWGSDVFGHVWNWYLIPFNPLPAILWLCLGRRKWFGKIFLFYTAVLVAFIAATPFLSQLDLSHQLITAALAVRCFSNYLRYKNHRQE